MGLVQMRESIHDKEIGDDEASNNSDGVNDTKFFQVFLFKKVLTNGYQWPGYISREYGCA
jgi:hypothetical protein